MLDASKRPVLKMLLSKRAMKKEDSRREDLKKKTVFRIINIFLGANCSEECFISAPTWLCE